MSAEDHLRFVITHFFRHGGIRPLWLCDIAALIEAATHDFDWGRCLGSDRRVAAWVRAGVSLAARLLHCDLNRVPAFVSDADRHPWIDDVVLREWTRPNHVRWNEITSPRSIPGRLRHVVPWIRARWPNSIQATIKYRGSLYGGLHSLYQTVDGTTCAARSFVRRAGTLLA